MKEHPLRFTSFRTAIGEVLLIATARGLARLHVGRNNDTLLRALQREFGEEPVMDAAGLGGVRQQIEAYVQGACQRFEIGIDWSRMTPFQSTVLQETARIPFGMVARYGDIAERIGQPGAARAVGGALGRNPVPIVVPCHRVVAHDGLGGFTGGLSLKRTLLDIETRHASVSTLKYPRLF